MAGAARRGVLGSGTGSRNRKQETDNGSEKHFCHFAAAAVVVSDACGRAVGVSRSQPECQDLPGRDPNRCVYNPARAQQDLLSSLLSQSSVYGTQAASNSLHVRQLGQQF